MTLHREAPPLSPEPAAARPGIRRGSTFQAAMWTIGGEGASHAMRLISNLVLTRLLFPEAFGLMSLVTVFAYGLNMLSDLGIRTIIVRHERGDEPDFLNTVWTVRLIRGAILTLAASALAWPLSHFYGEAQLALLFPATSLNLLLEGFQTTKLYSCERHLQLGKVTLINHGSSLFGILVMIAWAWIHPTVWSLVAGGLAGTFLKLVLSYVALPGPNNRFRWDPTAWREVSSFGRWVFLTSLVTFLSTRMDKLVFAKLIPMSFLGFYSIATNMAALSVQVVLKLASSVALPAFSHARERREELEAVFDRVRLPLLLAGGAGVSLLILCGPWIISILYDPRYAAAGWILQIAAIGAWFQVLEACHYQMLMALGKPKWPAVANGAQVVVTTTAILLGNHLGTQRGGPQVGFIAGLAAASIAESVRYAIECFQVRKAGLKSWGGERLVSGLILACGLVAMAVQHGPWFEGRPRLAGVLCFLVFSAVWSGAGLWYWRAKRAAA